MKKQDEGDCIYGDYVAKNNYLHAWEPVQSQWTNGKGFHLFPLYPTFFFQIKITREKKNVREEEKKRKRVKKKEDRVRKK